MATQGEVARHLFLDPSAVSRMLAAGELPAPGKGGLDLDACRERYILRLREAAAGRASGGANLVAERARLASAQSEAAERKNKVEAGELLPLADIELAITSLITISKARLRRVPARIAMGDEVLRQRAENAINDALDELSRERAMKEAVGGFDDGDRDSND